MLILWLVRKMPFFSFSLFCFSPLSYVKVLIACFSYLLLIMVKLGQLWSKNLIFHINLGELWNRMPTVK